MVRRRSSDVFYPVRIADLVERCAHLPPRAVVEALAGHVTRERYDKIVAVGDRRIASVRVLMDAPYDPHNGAAVVRSMEAFGLLDLHVVERAQPFLSTHAVSRGTEKWIEIHRHANAISAIVETKRDGFTLVGTHPEGTLLPGDLAKIPKLCLVLGNERDGIAEDLQAQCGASVRVPMRGFAESLNVSVTAAILLHAASDRPGDLPEERKERLLAKGLLTSVRHAEDVLRAKGILTT